MAALRIDGAHAPGQSTPTSDEAPVTAITEAPKQTQQRRNSDGNRSAAPVTKCATAPGVLADRRGRILDHVATFRAAIAAALGTAPDVVVPDGAIHRFGTTPKRGDDAGWYVLHLDRVPAGAFGDWRTQRVQTWCAKRNVELSSADRRRLAQMLADAKRAREADLRERRSAAAAASLTRWTGAGAAVGHRYLSAKGVGDHGLRADAGHLLIPMRDADGRLHSLQLIAANGTKRFAVGGRVTGCLHLIGRVSGTVIVAEGYATGASIHECTGIAVAVAFNAGNLQPVARALRGNYPCVSIIVAGDDDWQTQGNPGRAAAREAALSVGGIVVFPLFPPGRPPKATDFNDLHALTGPDAVRRVFAEVLEAA